MARPWRIEYEGALYHVFSRGNNQQDIFVTDDDRYLFLDTIGQMSERFDILIYLLWEEGKYTNKQIGILLGLTHSAVSRRVAITRKKIELEQSMNKRIIIIKSQIKP